MLYATEKDIIRCQIIVREMLHKKNVTKEESVIYEITLDIMNISYSKGGDYSTPVIRAFAETYIEQNMFEKFLN